MFKIFKMMTRSYLAELLIAIHPLVKTPSQNETVSDVITFFTSAEPDKDLANKIQNQFQAMLK